MSHPVEAPTAPEVMRVLGEPARWQIVQELKRQGPLPLGRLAEITGRSLDGVHRHLTILRSAGLIEPRNGQRDPYALREYPVCCLQAELDRLLGLAATSPVRDD